MPPINKYRVKVVNIRDVKPDLKQGRFRVDRNTRLGNPYRIGYDGDRDEVVEKFKNYLPNKLARDRPTLHYFSLIYKYLLANGEVTLVCWCAPERCHADAIREFLLEAVKVKDLNDLFKNVS